MQADSFFPPRRILLGPGPSDVPARVLGADEYFVAGDNRSVPLGEHLAGVVRRRRIAGRLL